MEASDAPQPVTSGDHRSLSERVTELLSKGAEFAEEASDAIRDLEARELAYLRSRGDLSPRRYQLEQAAQDIDNAERQRAAEAEQRAANVPGPAAVPGAVTPPPGNAGPVVAPGAHVGAPPPGFGPQQPTPSADPTAAFEPVPPGPPPPPPVSPQDDPTAPFAPPSAPENAPQGEPQPVDVPVDVAPDAPPEQQAPPAGPGTVPPTTE